MVAQAFQVFGHHKQVQRGFRLGRVGGDIVRNFGADPAEEGVGLVVAGDHLGGGGHIHLHIGADGLLDHAEHKVAHAVDISHHIKGFDNVLVKVQHNLRNVGSLVGNALNVGDHLERGGYLAQVRSHRLLAQNQGQAAVLHIMFHGVDLAVTRHNAARKFQVAVLQCGHGALNRAARRMAHTGQHGIKLEKFLVIHLAVAGRHVESS